MRRFHRSRGARSRRSRGLRWVGVGVLVLVVSWLVGGYFVVVNPVTNKLTRADAIIVLGSPDVDGRVDYALQLARKHYADTIAISVESQQQRRVKGACHGAWAPLRVMCFVPSPKTTQGEARQIRTYARERGWKQIIVVTSSYHVSRARMIVARCFSGKIIMSAPHAHHSVLQMAYQYAYQTAGYIKAFLATTGC